MNTPETAEFLCGLDGTDVTLDPPPEPPLHLPLIGTQYQSPQIRRKQAAKPQPHVELMTLKMLKKNECDVVPDLLAYQEGKQGDKVPGEPLSAEEFWELDIESRQAIRDKFREAFPKLKKYGYLPRMSTMSKMVYDKATGEMCALSVVEWRTVLTEIRHFSGFSRAGRTDTNEEWHDKYYVLFRLAKPSPTTDWAKDTTGWTW
ncbi:hypothetical protein N7523_002729 [Penicillium sp. IBT 18751x]|nr:hypothetical protein N7523_002729 [Penicillium sp. IBT 18751x]